METTINQRIANLRKAKRLTQKEFAEKLNVSDKLVSKWEQGDSTPALEEIVNISKIFDLTLDYLVHGKETKSDTEALKPLPPPPPPFVDPVQKLVKTINEIINKNKLQKYSELLFPSSSVNAIYDHVECIRKGNLTSWEHVDIPEGYHAYQFKEKYHEDRRSPKKLIDEKYWGQVATSYSACERYECDRHLKCGIFILNDYGYQSYEVGYNRIALIDCEISFGIDFNLLLELDNFEIYSKLTSCGIPLYCQYSKKPKLNATVNYFNLPGFSDTDYAELFIRLDYALKHRNESQADYERFCESQVRNYKSMLSERQSYHYQIRDFLQSLEKHEFYERDLSKVPLTYKELLSLTDLRFFSLLKKEELDLLLEAVDIKHKRVWEIIVTLIENGATKKKLVKSTKYNNEWVEADDPLSTLMLYEFAKMKLQNKE